MSFLLALCLLLGATAPVRPTITNAVDLARLTDAEVDEGRNFRLTATVVQGGAVPLVTDETGSILLRSEKDPQLNLPPGTIIRAEGFTQLYGTGERVFLVRTHSILGTTAVPPPTDVDPRQVADGSCGLRLVRVRGRVVDAFRDEIDPTFVYLILMAGERRLVVSIREYKDYRGTVPPLEGAEVEVTGACIPWQTSLRVFMGPIIRPTQMSDIRVLTPPNGNPDTFPELPYLHNVSPSAIRQLGARRIGGTVLGVWRGNQMLVRSADGHVHRVELARGQTLPSVHDEVTVGGLAETDLYLLNLSHAVCRIDRRGTAADESAEDISLDTLLFNDKGENQINPTYYGKAIRVRGRVIRPPSVSGEGGILHVDCGRRALQVDVSAFCDDPARLAEPASEVEATGVFVLDVDNWKPDSDFPQIRGVRLVARSAQDIRILKSPPWWTPGRLLVVIGSLLAVLLAVFIWNRALRRLVERRGRELYREQIAHATATLKVGERTRLAVELHDTLSQNLSGVACQIAATRNALGENPDAARRLDAAERMLLSSRAELRRCLLDLRGNALENADFAAAIRKTTQPAIGDTALAVRFNVPRARLHDSTAHAILCIIRELASNGVRHGHATSVKVAGCLDGGKLLFSVRENGSGFAPETAPGPDDGHFGLEGIRERVRKLGGTFTLTSSPGGGTCSEIALDVPRADNGGGVA